MLFNDMEMSGPAFCSYAIPDPAIYVSSLKMDELKAELNNRGLKRSGNKSALIDRLRLNLMSKVMS